MVHMKNALRDHALISLVLSTAFLTLFSNFAVVAYFLILKA